MAAERPTPLVLGGDLGGTSTRIVIADHEGTVVGRGIAGGGNPTSHPESAAAALGTALKAALDGVDPGLVRTAVIGAAGQVSPVRARFDAVWHAAGLTCPAEYIPDLEVAFASGTPEPDGTGLIAGTGAGAGAIRGNRLTRTADANGWLLGDDGSGFWLGRQAVRATLLALEVDEPLGTLGNTVSEMMLGEPAATIQARPPEPRSFNRLRDELIRAANSRPPVQLAELARAVVIADDAGDPAAHSIVERAADLLTETVSRVRNADEDGPFVLAGSVAGESSPVGKALRRRIAERFAGPVLTAKDGIGGATWLALAELDPALATHAAHTRLATPLGG